MLALVATAAVALFVPAGAGAAQSSETLAPGTVVGVAAPATATSPADGRVRGVQFDASVTGVAWPETAREGPHTLVAGSGHRLVVFSLQVTEAVGAGSLFAAGTRASAVVDVGHTAVSVPMGALDAHLGGDLGSSPATASASYCLSVPAHVHDVVLAMTQDATTQRFDLWTLQRTGKAPAVLYRAPTGSFAIPASSQSSTTLSASDPAGHSAPIALSVRQAFLSAFPPGTSTTAIASHTAAYLDVELLGTDRSDSTLAIATIPWTFEFTSPLAAGHLRFTPTGGSAVGATLVPAPTSTASEYDDGLFDAWYSFVVTAATTSGTLEVTGGTVDGQTCSYQCTQSGPITLGSGTIALSFPTPVPSSSHQHRPSWVTAPLPATGAEALGQRAAATKTATAHRTARGSGGFPVWAALVVLALVAGALLATQRWVRGHRRLATLGASDQQGTGAEVALPGDPPVAVSVERPVASPAGDPSQVTETPTTEPALHEVPPVTGGGGRVSDEPGVSTLGLAPSVDAPPPLGGDGDLVVRMLGPASISGAERPGERPLIMEDLCCFLAEHTDRGLSSAEVMEAIWPLDGERGEASRKTFHNTIARFRQWVGPDHLPDAATTGGYRLVGVVTDWGEVRRLLAAAAAATDEGARALRSQALAHVRGEPFQGAHATQFHWAFTSGLASSMAATVAQCAHDHAADLLAHGDPAGAERAARQGLRGAPEDERLWADAARAARATGDSGALERVVRDAAAAIGPAAAKALRHQPAG